MLLVALVLGLAAEITAFVLVAGQIGVLAAVLLLLGTSALGPFVVSRVGMGIVARTRARMAAGELPGRELLDGLLVFVAGVFICVPGFVGDAVGLLLLLPPVRSLVVKVGGYGVARRVSALRIAGRVVDARSRPTGPFPAPPGPPVIPPPPVQPRPGPD
jgi:UPF0716 protein FxsA